MECQLAIASSDHDHHASFHSLDLLISLYTIFLKIPVVLHQATRRHSPKYSQSNQRSERFDISEPATCPRAPERTAFHVSMEFITVATSLSFGKESNSKTATGKKEIEQACCDYRLIDRKSVV